MDMKNANVQMGIALNTQPENVLTSPTVHDDLLYTKVESLAEHKHATGDKVLADIRQIISDAK